MANSVYQINKGINAPLVFKGLKAQYIWYLGGGLVVLLILFVLLYIIGVNTFIILIAIGGAGTFLFTKVYKMSRTHGQYGVMKRTAKRLFPKAIRCHGRKIFINNSTLSNGQ